MADVAFIAITIAFFVICTAVVRLCDRVIGPDSEHLPGPVAERAEDEPAPVTTGAAR
jgi:hypothetical protein